MERIFLLTGGNVGDRLATLGEAREGIAQAIGPIVQASGLYETAAWGQTEQPDFLNQVLEVETLLSPREVLNQIQLMEAALGRVKTSKWGPRLIDIDILFYGTAVVSEPDLHIPHPEIPTRRFVLEPLVEIAPDWVHPVLKVDVQTLLARTSDDLPVRRLAV